MDFKLLFTVFGIIFLAELGDKTQLAVMALAANNQKGLLSILIGSTLALFLTSLIGVLLGGVFSRYIPAEIIRYVAGGLFMSIGFLMIIHKI